MEIMIVVVIVLVIIFVWGGVDNNRPVKDWSDDKLSRMHGKLIYAATANSKAGNHAKASEHIKKAKEVEEEIENRKQRRIKELGDKQFDFNNTADFAELARLMAEKSFALLQKTMSEYSCSEDRAKEIVSARIDALTKDYMNKGMSEDDAGEKAMKDILGIIS